MTKPLSLSPEFLADLEATYDAELHDLAKALEGWSDSKREFIRSRLATTSPDDVLLCPISLLNVVDYGRREPVHTRILAWFIDPRNQHGFGDRILKAFFAKAIGIGKAANLTIDRVDREYPVDVDVDENYRFLDILAVGSFEQQGQQVPWALIVEAKIDHTEGDRQLSKYGSWAAKCWPDHRQFLVFLTRDGRPSEAGAEGWIPFSFLQVATIFRSLLPSLQDTWGYHLLRYYVATILIDVYGWPLPIRADCPDPYSVAAFLKQAP